MLFSPLWSDHSHQAMTASQMSSIAQFLYTLNHHSCRPENCGELALSVHYQSRSVILCFHHCYRWSWSHASHLDSGEDFCWNVFSSSSLAWPQGEADHVLNTYVLRHTSCIWGLRRCWWTVCVCKSVTRCSATSSCASKDRKFLLSSGKESFHL